MRILVHPHHMEMGGSQYNAIELADSVRALGHTVVLYAPPGILTEEVHRRGLEMVQAPRNRLTAPSPVSAARLARVAKEREVDLVHAYEWTATLDAFYGPSCLHGIPVVSTVLSMWIPSYLPRAMAMVVGTRELLATESERRADVTLIEPPVDTHYNRPGAAPTFGDSGVSVRERWDIGPDEFLLVLVGRLAADLKIAGVLEAVRAMGLLPSELRAHLLIVGDGPERARVEEAAAQLNSNSPRRRVTLTGLLMDPRPTYDAADLVLGMGGSVLRGLAFGKPAIVQGERGFWQPVDSTTVPIFLHQGWFGIGAGDDGAPRLAQIIKTLMATPGARARNGAMGRQLILDRYGLDAAAASLVEVYERARGPRPSPAERMGAAANTTYQMARSRAAAVAHRADDRVRGNRPRALANPGGSGSTSGEYL